MRTRTLLITAVVGAAGIAAATAAPVYSVNAVGYINVVLCPGWNIIANQLNNQATGGNTVDTLFPTPPDGTTIYKWELKQGTWGYSDANTYILGLGWSDGTMKLDPGEGFWMYNPGTANLTVTLVGEVPQGHLVNNIPAGWSIESSMVPQAGRLSTAPPNGLGFPVANNDTIYTFNVKNEDGKATPDCAAGYSDAFSYIDGLGWQPYEPWILVGEGFWTFKDVAADWVRDFNINE